MTVTTCVFHWNNEWYIVSDISECWDRMSAVEWVIWYTVSDVQWIYSEWYIVSDINCISLNEYYECYAVSDIQ